MLTATAGLAAAGRGRGVMAAAAAAWMARRITLARAGLRALQPWEGLERKRGDGRLLRALARRNR